MPNYNDPPRNPPSKGLFGFFSGKKIIAIFGTLAVAGTLLGGVYQVGPTDHAIVKQFGAIQREVASNGGLQFKLPFVETVTMIPTNVVTMKITGPEVSEGNYSGIETYTTDNQVVRSVLTVNYRVPESKAREVYTNNPDYVSKLESIVISRYKDVMGKYNTNDIAQSRAAATTKVLDAVRGEAARLLGVEVTEFQITNIKYSDTFEKAVEETSTAKAAVTKAEQLKQQAQIDADTALVKANGDAAARVAGAKAEAESIRLKGEADADAIKAKSDALSKNKDLVDLTVAERWNGQLPTVTTGGNGSSILNIDAGVIGANKAAPKAP